MPSPAFVGCDQYGVDTAHVDGDWPASRPLDPPSFAADMCLVVLVADYLTGEDAPELHHWAVPGSWERLGGFGTSLRSGTGSVVVVAGEVFWCLPGQVAATVRPETASNTLLSPTGAALRNYWRAFVTGWTPAKRFDWDRDDNTRTGAASETDTTIPAGGWGATTVTGLGEGTLVQFGAGNISFSGGGPTGVHTANGFTEDYSAGQFRVASREFSTDTTTTPLVWTKGNGAFRLGATAVFALDKRMRRRGGRHLGLVRGSRGVG